MNQPLLRRIKALDLRMTIKKRYAISYWDSAVIAAAKALDCAQIYTEDLNPGQEYEGVRAINPFI